MSPGTRPPFLSRFRGKSSAGRREDLDDKYFRSAWEANYARYLNRCIKLGQVWRWEYEPDVFYFEGIRRGTTNYTPDFKVWPVVGNDDRFYYVEVKGYLRPKDKTKLKRMKKYHPHVEVRLVDQKEYKMIEGCYALMIPTWEYCTDKS